MFLQNRRLIFISGFLMILLCLPKTTFAYLNYKGMDYVSWWRGEYSWPQSNDSLDNLKDTNSNYVGVLVTWYMDNRYSNTIEERTDPDQPPSSPSTADVIEAISDIRSRGMSVMLKPHVDVLDGTWRGDIAPSNINAWFESYRSFVNLYAQIAEQNGVELFSIGTEFQSLSNANLDQWEATISGIRAEGYTGDLTYAANWTEYPNVIFWDQVDLVGIDAYFPLTNNAADPSLEEIMDGWTNYSGQYGTHNWVEEIETWQASLYPPKQVIFTEIGYCSTDHAADEPWNCRQEYDYNGDLQARCYQAAISVFRPKQWFEGTFFWNWLTYPEAGGAGNKDYTPQNKPAEEILTFLYSWSIHLAVPYFLEWQFNYSGAASVQMALDYLGNYYSQDEIQEYGQAMNAPENSDIPYLDPLGVSSSLNYFEPGDYNFGIGTQDVVEDALAGISYWVANEIPEADPEHSPAVVPTYAGYENWMVIRGVLASDNPRLAQDYTLYGFWINDPNPEGIGQNSFKTAFDWVNDYYLRLNTQDTWDEKFVYVVEPPAQSDAEVTIALPIARFDDEGEKVNQIIEKGSNLLLLQSGNNPPTDEEVIEAAMVGLSEQLLPFDGEVAALYEGSFAGEPLLVEKTGGNYYLVPFIRRSFVGEGSQQNLIEGQSQPNSNFRRQSIIKEDRVVIVCFVNAGDGHFQEASWQSIDEALADFPRLTQEEALEILEQAIGPFEPDSVELIFESGFSLYEPSWKITIAEDVYIINQDGHVTYPSWPSNIQHSCQQIM